MEWCWTLLLCFSLILKTYEFPSKDNEDIFFCSDGETQLEGGEVCDGIKNCPFSDTNPLGGEDEQDCSSELPSPKIVIVGATGTGKSSMANSLLGLDPETDNLMFEVCDSFNSCTKETTYGVGQWLGDGSHFTVVDTPGFGDSDNEDTELIREMLDVLKNTVKNADAIVLLIKGSDTRFTAGLQSMLMQMSSVFGEQWWNFMIIGVSFWEYDRSSITKREKKCLPKKNCKDEIDKLEKNCLRNKKCKDEKWFQGEIQSQLEDKFNVQQNFSFAFVHSYSQTEDNIEDEQQQKYWKQETDKIWQFATSRNSTFEFKDVDDIIEDNRRMKREVARLNNIIEDNITALAGRMDIIQEDIIFFKTTTVQKLETDLRDVMKSSETDLRIEILHVMPVGTILAWVTKPDTDPYTPMLSSEPPSGWMKCDGRLIMKGIWKGRLTPNLNGERRFLRGSNEAQQLVLEECQLQEHNHFVNDPKHDHPISDPGHTHSYWDKYNGHKGRYGGGSYGMYAQQAGKQSTTDEQSTNIVIQKSKTNVSVQGVKPSKISGNETRPKNMGVIYIIKIY